MIEAQGLTMKYGSVVALKEASFKVGKGEVVGLLGPNGAGKSTTMKIITTYLVPTSGTASVGGHDVVNDPIPARRLIGYLPEVLPLYLNMEIAEYLDFVGRARGLSGTQLRERTKWVVDRCGLKPMYRRPIQELSKGYRQRTGLAQALIHDPEIVILDEPTSGLDPHQIQEVRALIREIAASKTVILSTHILQEAEAMSDRIIIINQGQIVSQGTLRQLRSQAHETNRVHFSVSAPRAEADQALEGIAAVKLRTLRAEENGGCSFALIGADAGEIINAVGKLALEKNWRVTELTDVPYSLEETFLTLTHSAYAKKGGAA